MHVTGRSTAPAASTRSTSASSCAELLDCPGIDPCRMVRGKGEVVSIDARDPAHPQRLAPSRPPAPANDEPPATPAPSDRRIGLTPITLLLVLVVGYLLIQIQFVAGARPAVARVRDRHPDPGRCAGSATRPATTGNPARLCRNHRRDYRACSCSSRPRFASRRRRSASRRRSRSPSCAAPGRRVGTRSSPALASNCSVVASPLSRVPVRLRESTCRRAPRSACSPGSAAGSSVW